MLRVTHLIQDAARFVSDGCMMVTPEQYRERLSACENCPKRARRTCTLCGCFIRLRAKARALPCPHDPPKWPVIIESPNDESQQGTPPPEAAPPR